MILFYGVAMTCVSYDYPAGSRTSSFFPPRAVSLFAGSLLMLLIVGYGFLVFTFGWYKDVLV